MDRSVGGSVHGGDPADAFDVIVPSLPGFAFSTRCQPPDMNFWKIADLWHTLMTRPLGYRKYAAAGCDVGVLVTGQLGHKYADELYAIHIGSGLKLSLFTGDRAWDLSGGQPIPDGLPADIRAGIVARDKRFAVHPAAHVLDPSTLGYGLSTHRPGCSPGWWTVVEAPTGITFVGYENPLEVTTERRIQHFLDSDRAAWYIHVNLRALFSRPGLMGQVLQG